MGKGDIQVGDGVGGGGMSNHSDTKSSVMTLVSDRTSHYIM